MSLTLAIDCAFPTAVIAIGTPEAVLWRSFGPQRSHALRLIGELESLLDEAGLPVSAIERIGVGQGPGSFTGLRVALASASGLVQAAGAELVGFASFDALPVWDEPTLIAFDARAGMVYSALAQGETWLEAPRPRSIAEAAELGARAQFVYGEGLQRYPELGEGLIVRNAHCHADPDRAIALSRAAVPGRPVLPTYKEGAQAQKLFGSPDIGRALDGDEL